MHTAGPWHVGTANGTAVNHAIMADDMVIGRAMAFGHPVGIGWHENSEANARLMAAAPDLLAALEVIVKFLGDGPELPPGLKLYERAQAAIAKAKGAQS